MWNNKSLNLQYFTKKEFVMGKINVFNKMNPTFLLQLDELRGLVDEPLTVKSSYRDKKYNKKVGGSVESKHMESIAVDLHCDNGTLRGKIVHHALNLGMSVGVSGNFIHVDSRDKQILFTY